MPLPPGTSIGPYEVLGPIGAGGMGEVLKARDKRLNRTVAIKILADSGDGSKALLREAQAASALNHPNIITVYDILSQDGRDGIVMEYVEGSTLAERIGRKGLVLRVALTFAIQTADALAAAHAAGIVHRDVKPRNVMVTESGVVKVLDFGLAQAERPVGPEDETATASMPGMIAGTFLYMSPEQAEGKKVDARSDIFSFGALLHEMLTGRAAFQGDSKVAILTAVMHKDPAPVRSLRPEAPPELERLVQRCLRKDPAQRMQSMADVRLLLEEVRDNPVTAPAAGAPRRRWTVPLAFAGLALAALSMWRSSRVPQAAAYRLTPFATEAAQESSPAWSADGRTLAYEYSVDGVSQIYTRSLDASSGTRVTNSPAPCLLPFWSPDGSRIYYHSASKLWSVGPAGGVPQLAVADVTSAGISPDGKAMAMIRGGVGSQQLWIASPVGTEPKVYRAAPFPDKVTLMAVPQFSPDNSKIAVIPSREGATSEPELWILPYPSGAPARVPVRLPGNQGGYQRSAWMGDSRHLIISIEGHLAQVDTRSGSLQPITLTTLSEVQPSVSPDGRRLAFSSGSEDSDIMQIALDSGSIRPVLATARSESNAVWSPTGSQFAYVTTSAGSPEIWLRSRQDNGARPLVRQDASLPWYDLEKLSFSPDGNRIAYDLYTKRHLVAISNVAGGRPVIPDSESTDQHGISWSPDGNWIAYRRLNGAKWELVKRPLGGGEPVWLDEAEAGGATTDWSRSGEWICHPNGAALRLVSADGSRHVTIGSSRTAGFAFSPDGSALYSLRRNPAKRWELVMYAVPGGQETKVLPLELPVEARVSGLSANPDGKSVITALSQARYDIWFLDGLGERR